MVTRQRASAFPALAFAAIPAMRYGPVGISIRSALPACAIAEPQITAKPAINNPSHRIGSRVCIRLARRRFPVAHGYAIASGPWRSLEWTASRALSDRWLSEPPAPSHHKPALLQDSDIQSPLDP